MVTKRIPKHRAVKARITPEIVALWRTFCEAGTDPDGLSQEQWNAQMALNVRLGRRPWDVFVQHADGPEPPSGTDESQAESWREAWRLRCALDDALGRLGAANPNHGSELKSPEPVEGDGAGSLPALKGR